MTMPPLFAWPWELTRSGVLGMNERNLLYISKFNRRKNYRAADDKFLTKQLAASASIPTPKLYERIQFMGDLRTIEQALETHEQFVIKPARGSGGNGVLVIAGRSEEGFRTVSGNFMSLDELRKHCAKILHGLFSLGGRPDSVLIEQKVNFSQALSDLSFQGVPDFRVIALKGHPVMAMGRFPTSRSRGKANLHQGAVGIGIKIDSGVTFGGVLAGKVISSHPDTGAKLSGVKIPHWPEVLSIASQCCELTKLGYLGVDVVLDESLGPLLLEINVRPGLAIQIANQIGLKKRLREIESF